MVSSAKSFALAVGLLLCLGLLPRPAAAARRLHQGGPASEPAGEPGQGEWIDGRATWFEVRALREGRPGCSPPGCKAARPLGAGRPLPLLPVSLNRETPLPVLIIAASLHGQLWLWQAGHRLQLRVGEAGNRCHLAAPGVCAVTLAGCLPGFCAPAPALQPVAPAGHLLQLRRRRCHAGREP